MALPTRLLCHRLDDLNDAMTFNAQIEDITSALRVTRSRLLAPIDLHQYQLPRDPEIFVEDTLQYVMDEWSSDLRSQGHVLEEDTQWKDGVNHYPRYLLRMAGGDLAQIHFTGEYPRALYLSISKGFRNGSATHARYSSSSPSPPMRTSCC